ncbi:hypothetical protein OAV62_01615, partial [bacterium]|nr:hypothetical protein [bacterium]
MKHFKFDGYTIWVGQTRRETWELLDEMDALDMLFHLSSLPSGYIFLKNSDRVISSSVKKHCGELCKRYTKYKTLPSVYVDFTFCENVSKG